MSQHKSLDRIHAEMKQAAIRNDVTPIQEMTWKGYHASQRIPKNNMALPPKRYDVTSRFFLKETSCRWPNSHFCFYFFSSYSSELASLSLKALVFRLKKEQFLAFVYRIWNGFARSAQ